METGVSEEKSKIGRVELKITIEYSLQLSVFTLTVLVNRGLNVYL